MNPLFPVLKGPEDGFVTKIDPAKIGASSLEWSTFLGGSGNDGIYGVATDWLGDIYVTGYAGAGSTDYPLKDEVQEVARERCPAPPEGGRWRLPRDAHVRMAVAPSARPGVLGRGSASWAPGAR